MPVRRDKFSCAEILSLLENSNLNLKQLAEKLNVSPMYFYNWLTLQSPEYKAKLEKYKFKNVERKVKRWDVEAEEVLVLLKTKNFSMTELAQYYGVHRSAVSHWAARQTPEVRAELALYHRKPGKPRKPKVKKRQLPAITPAPPNSNMLPMGLIRPAQPLETPKDSQSKSQ
jgi:transcriptional regulator with XRE-family HTH domain